MRRATAILMLACLLPGCALGPNYQRPQVATPDLVRGDAAAEAASMADLPWWQVFSDPVLQRLVEEAITGNRDLAAAVARVEAARNLVVVARADMLPQVGYEAGASRQRSALPAAGGGAITFNNFLASFNLAWEIDLWGRIRRSTEAARADLLAAEHARRGVLLTLVSDVAQAYFELLGLDRSLEITRSTIATFRSTADLFDRRFRGGVGTLLEVSRARAALSNTEATLPELEMLTVAKENQLAVLLGRAPEDIPRGIALETQPRRAEIPVGLPSQLLERRPDVLAAEQDVVAANAEVGIATANFFPRFGLTSLYGGQSTELENIVKGNGNVWAAAGSLAGPVFQGGRLIASRRAALARRDEATERYRQVVLTAFAEVSSALATHEKLQVARIQREESAEQLELSVKLSLQRYTDGISSYFEVLEAQQEYFPAEIQLARVQRDELVAVVSLYRALGGGWQLEPAEWTAQAGAPTLPTGTKED